MTHIEKLEIEKHRLEIERLKLEANKLKQESYKSSMEATISFATIGLKGLLILNGAAAISLLALMGNMVRTDYLPHASSLASALTYFGWGGFLEPCYCVS